MNNFQRSLVLTRVMTSGVIMSIEKNDRQLPALETLIKNKTGRKYVGLFNSKTGAIHAALHGLQIVFGDKATFCRLSYQEEKFIRWLGIRIEKSTTGHQPYELSSVEWDEEKSTFDECLSNVRDKKVAVLDFTALGFGPCAAVVTDDELVWKRAERLKIFGAFDLRTMWSQSESAPEVQPAIQFNYRLSPLVAACVRQAIQGN